MLIYSKTEMFVLLWDVFLSNHQPLYACIFLTFATFLIRNILRIFFFSSFVPTLSRLQQPFRPNVTSWLVLVFNGVIHGSVISGKLWHWTSPRVRITAECQGVGIVGNMKMKQALNSL